MPEGLRRRYGLRHLHFITCSCYRRLPLLGSTLERDLFVETLGDLRDRYQSALAGYVVMPEHVHLLIGEPVKGTPSTVMQVLKQRVSRELRENRRQDSSAKQLRRFVRDSPDSLPQFWEPRFYDFNVWSQTKFVEKLHYMHMNPVKRELVTHPRDWRWSSFSFYAKKEVGLIRIDPIN